MLLFFLAAIILPSVLGCCLPEKYQGFSYITGRGKAGPSEFTIDFAQKKYYSKPMDGRVDFYLVDFGAGKHYEMNKGNCTVTNLPTDIFERCVPSSGTSAQTFVDIFGPSTGGLSVKSTVYKENGDEVVWLTSNDGKCHPIARIGKGYGPEVDTLMFANITVTIDATVFNQDLTGCLPMQ